MSALIAVVVGKRTASSWNRLWHIVSNLNMHWSVVSTNVGAIRDHSVNIVASALGNLFVFQTKEWFPAESPEIEVIRLPSKPLLLLS